LDPSVMMIMIVFVVPENVLFSLGSCGPHLGFLCSENTTQVFVPTRIPDVPFGQITAIAALPDLSVCVIGELWRLRCTSCGFLFVLSSC
jgi:hypothetical protein